MNRDPNFEIWDKSEILACSFWDSYNRFIKFAKLNHFNILDHESEIVNEATSHRDHNEFTQSPDHDVNNYDHDCDGQEEVNKEYLEFIKITRHHQIERDRLKKIELAKRNAEPEEYYTDLSELDTLALDNLAEVPDRNDKNARQESQKEKYIKLYGSLTAYDKIRSMEMSIDESFKSKCQEMNPKFWPVIPINPKPYLNKLKSNS